MSRQFPVFAGQCAQGCEADLHAPAGEAAAEKVRNEMFAEMICGIHWQRSFLKSKVN